MTDTRYLTANVSEFKYVDVAKGRKRKRWAE